MAQRFASPRNERQRAYLNHDILGPHLIKCTRLVMAVSENQITDGLESPVDMKFRSSMTLFDSI
jgi:uncharacterized protein (DUF1810 family)